jgi:glutamyl-tRNA synthetase
MDYQKLAALLFPDVTQTPEDMERRFPPRALPEGAVVSRMAPSPTGFVHLGNLVQGFTSERLSHQSGGVLFLRIEDTDAKREVPGAVEILIDALRHYHITFDEGASVEGDIGDYGPYRQRRRAEIYHIYARQLVSQGMAYPCFCTEEELAEMRRKQEAEKLNFGYYGPFALWRDRPLEEIEAQLSAGTPWVLRFRSEGSIENKIKFTDLIKGNLELTENDIDHVLLKSDGIPTYHFAHAVDDHLMRTTLVVRGDEWLPSLPFHVQLFRALGFKLPKYAHIGTLQKMDGTAKRKLSKRKDPELSLAYYREQGYPTEAVSEYLMTILNSNFEDWRRANPDAPLNDFRFSAKKMNPAGSLFDLDKLRDVSKNVIARMNAAAVFAHVLDWALEFDPAFAAALSRDPAFSTAIFAIGRGGKKPRKDLAVWAEAKGYMGFFFDEYFSMEDAVDGKFSKTDIRVALQAFAANYNPDDGQNVWFDKIKTIADTMGYAADMKAYRAEPEKYRGSVADISMFLRIAVTGKINSPDMYEVMRILGRETVLGRIRAMLETLN